MVVIEMLISSDIERPGRMKRNKNLFVCPSHSSHDWWRPWIGDWHPVEPAPAGEGPLSNPRMAQEPTPARTVIAYIRDKSFEVNIADGSQSVDWLADVVLFKYKRSQFEKLNCRGVKYHNKMLDMNLSIASQVQDKEDVYILLEGDEEVDQMFGDEI
jgi:hypothetical protein